MRSFYEFSLQIDQNFTSISPYKSLTTSEKKEIFLKKSKNYVIRCSRVYKTLGMSRLDVSRQLFLKKLCWWRWSVDPTKNLRKMSVTVAPPPSDFQRKFCYFEGGNCYTYQGIWSKKNDFFKVFMKKFIDLYFGVNLHFFGNCLENLPWRNLFFSRTWTSSKWHKRLSKISVLNWTEKTSIFTFSNMAFRRP